MRSLWSRLARPLMIGLVAAALSATLFLLAHYTLGSKHYVRVLLLERGPIQGALDYTFWITSLLLVLEHRRFIHESRAFSEAGHVVTDFGKSGPHNVEELTDLGTSVREAVRTNTLTRSRILTGLDRLRKTGDAKSLEDYFAGRSDLDAAELDTRYSLIRYLIWLTPTLGFIGTVLGLGGSIAGFSSLVASGLPFSEIQAHLGPVTRNLGVAFDTTLLALVLSAILAFYLAYLTRQHENLLTKIDALCMDDICSLLRTRSLQHFLKTLAETTVSIALLVEGSRDKIVEVIQRDLPRSIGERVGSVAPLLDHAMKSRDLLESILENLRGQRGEQAQSNSAVESSLVDLRARLDEQLAALIRLGEGLSSNYPHSES